MLLEVIVAVAILVALMPASMMALSSGIKGVSTVDTLTTAQGIARSQMQYTLSSAFMGPTTGCSFPCSYPTITGLPSGYTVTSVGQSYSGEDTLEEITVSIYKNDAVTFTLTGLKADIH